MDATVSSPHAAGSRLTVRDKAGLLVRPLVFAPKPGPYLDESLLGLLARAASRNGFFRLGRLLPLADIDSVFAPSLPMVHERASGRLAVLLKVDEEQIRRRMYATLESSDRRTVMIDFFGVPVRASYRESRARRVSPLSLRRSAHHRAVWELRPFSFCPESRETLLDTCPVCGSRLGWSNSQGITHCDHCATEDWKPSVDLRDFPQPLIECTDETALDLVCDLIHPDPTRKARARSALAPEFAPFGSGDLFETIIALGCATTAPPTSKSKTITKFGTLSDYGKLTPQVLADAGRVLMNWPDGFCAIAERMRKDAHLRPGHAGLSKELGMLAALAWNQDLPRDIRALLSRGNDAAMASRPDPTTGVRYRKGMVPEGYLTQREAAQILKVRAVDMKRLTDGGAVETIRVSGAVQAASLFRKADVEAVAAARGELLPADGVVARLGVPHAALADLSERGLIVRDRGPATLLRSDATEFYGRASLERLVSDLRVAAGPPSTSGAGRTGTATRLTMIVRRIAMFDFPWGALFQAILKGELQVTIADGSFPDLTSGLNVVDGEAVSGLVSRVGPVEPRPDELPMTEWEASFVVGEHPVLVFKLVESGLVASNGARHRRITRDALVAFRRDHAFTPELARRLGVANNDVRRTMAELGVHPVTSFENDKQLVWPRSALDVASPEAAARARADLLTHRQVADMLGTGAPMAGALLRHGFLSKPAGSAWGIRRADVETFKREYVLTGELARELGILPKLVPSVMARQGIEPVASVMAAGGHVWRRDVITVVRA